MKSLLYGALTATALAVAFVFLFLVIVMIKFTVGFAMGHFVEFLYGDEIMLGTIALPWAMGAAACIVPMAAVKHGGKDDSE